MRRRFRPAKLVSIGNVLEKELKKRGVPVQFQDTRLRDTWEEAVGPVIAAQTRAESRKKDTLNVKVSSSVWMQQLHFLRDEITQKVNRVFTSDPIKNIRFRIGDIPSPPPAKEKKEAWTPGRLSFLRERDKKMIEETTATLKDPELKALLKRMMEKEISRRRLMEKQAAKGPQK
jgi:hypothetical protein